jgi:hypothetical protein
MKKHKGIKSNRRTTFARSPAPLGKATTRGLFAMLGITSQTAAFVTFQTKLQGAN